MENRLKGALFATWSALSYALFLVVSKYILKGISPFVLGTAAFGGASALLWLGVALSGGKRKVASIPAKLGHLLAIGAVGSMIQVSTLVGLKFSSPTNAAIITRVDIGIALLLGLIFLRERPRALDLPGALLMIGGALRTVGLGEEGFRLGIGDLLFLVAALGLSTNALLIKLSFRWLDRFVVAAFNTATMCLVSTVFAFALREASDFAWLVGNPASLLPPLFFASAIATYYFSLTHLPIWLARAFTLLQPPIAAALAAVIVGEPFLARQAQGMALLILGGAMVVAGSKIDRPKGGGKP